MKYLIILMLLCGVAKAQTPTLTQPTATGGWTNPNAGAYGTIQQGLTAWKALGFPTGNGAPTLTQKTDINTANLYFDSTGGLMYVYNPKGNIWVPILSTGNDTILIPGSGDAYLDSTGQPQFRNLFSLPGRKIGSSPFWLYDSVNKRVLIGFANMSVLNNTFGLGVNSNIYAKGATFDFNVAGNNNFMKQDPTTKEVYSDSFYILKVEECSGCVSRISNDTLYVDVGGGGGSQTMQQTYDLSISDNPTIDADGNRFDINNLSGFSFNATNNTSIGTTESGVYQVFNDGDYSSGFNTFGHEDSGAISTITSGITSPARNHNIQLTPNEISIFSSGTGGTNVKITGLQAGSTSDSILSITNDGAVGKVPYPTGGGGTGTVTTVTGTSPIVITSTPTTTPNVTIADAAADGSTKGAASFTANDFNATSGNISIDYTNGQAANGSTKGFLTAADWTTFNNKIGAAAGSFGWLQFNRNSLLAASDSLTFNAGEFLNKGTTHLNNANGTPGTDSVLVQSGGIVKKISPSFYVDISGGGLANRLPYWVGTTSMGRVDSIFVDASTANAPKISFGTNGATHTITIDSLRGIAGISLYKSKSQATNYERLNISNSSGGSAGSGYIISTESIGTGTPNRPIYLGNNSVFVQNGVVGCSQLSASSFVNTGVLIATTRVSANLMSTTNSATSGANVGIGYGVQNSQTGTAGLIAHRIFYYNATGGGSGTNKILEVGINNNSTGTSTQTNAFDISTGLVTTFYKPIATTGSTPSNTPGTGSGTSPTVSITGNDAAGYISIATGTSPTASGDIVTVTFSTALTNTPTSIQLTPANEAAATESIKVYVDRATVSSSSWKIKNTSSALTASTTYIFYYTVTQ